MLKSYISHSEDETSEIAITLSNTLKTGQTILLEGDLGAGKTFFARALIRALCNDNDLNVPSPTFTLCQNYETPVGDLWHYDLYRLKSPDEVFETGWEEIINQDILLIEWPERLGYLTPPEAMTIKIKIKPNNVREIIITK